MPSDSPVEAMAQLLDDLKSAGASTLAEDIQAEVRRGTLREITLPRGKIEEARTPYTPEDAYVLAVRMLLAAIEPALMLHELRTSLAQVTGSFVEVVWRADYLEEAQDRTDLEKVDQLTPLSDSEIAVLSRKALEVVESLPSVPRKE